MNHLKTVADVCSFLESEGYVAPWSTVDRHYKRGLFGLSKDGVFDPDAVRAYAASPKGLKRAASGKKVQQEQAEFSREREKVKLDTEREILEMKRMQREKMQGALVRKDVLFVELAARGGVLESMLKSAVQKKVRELVHLVGGKPDRATDLLQEVNAMIDRALDEYARTDNFDVVFEDSEA